MEFDNLKSVIYVVTEHFCVNQQYNVILSITVNGQENESRMVI